MFASIAQKTCKMINIPFKNENLLNQTGKLCQVIRSIIYFTVLQRMPRHLADYNSKQISLSIFLKTY